MPTPTKRARPTASDAAETAEASAQTPTRSSKRLRTSTQYTEEEAHAPATTPARQRRRTVAEAEVPVTSRGIAVVSRVVKEEELAGEETPPHKNGTTVRAEQRTPNRKGQAAGAKGASKTYASPSKAVKQVKKAADSRAANIKTEVAIVDAADGRTLQIAVAEQRNGHRTSRVNTAADTSTAASPSNGTGAGGRAQAKRGSSGRGKGKGNSSADMAPLAARATRTALRIGAHVSAAGGVQNSVGNAVHIGANAFALFLKSQRKWANPPLQGQQAGEFISACKQHEYNAGKHIVPHGSYLVNLAQADADKGRQAYESFVDDLQRCDTLGIKLYNFHPGNTGGQPRSEALKRIAERLNQAHAATSSVVTLLENMAGQGNVIGSTWADLGAIISHVADKSRVGVCLDTCHAFAAGHELRSPASLTTLLDDLEQHCGKGMLRALHVNDSKAPLGSHRDLHANLGTGYLGLAAFHALVNEPRLHGLPMLLETPIDTKDAVTGKIVEDRAVWAREIKLLESLVGMDIHSREFVELDNRLAALGQAERARIADQVSRTKTKSAAAAGNKRKKVGTSDDEHAGESE